MTAVPDKPRAGSVRVFIIFGISGLILLLVGSGIFYHYFAHRWWPEFVARTTPFSGQLWELLFTLPVNKFPWQRVIDSSRIQGDFLAIFSQHLDDEDPRDERTDGLYICFRIVEFPDQAAGKSALFAKIRAELTSPERWRRGRAAILMGAWKQGAENYPADWIEILLAAMEILNEPASAGMPWFMEKHRDLVYWPALQCNNKRIIPCILAADPRVINEYSVRRFASRLKNPRISPDVAVSDIACLLHDMELHQDVLAVICVEIIAKKYEYSEACVDLACRHPQLLQATMKGLQTLPIEQRYAAISHHWPQVAALIRSLFEHVEMVGINLEP